MDNNITTCDMQKKISFIVPVYNGEAFIHKIVNNVLSQTYSNVELVLVNDGSQDISYQLCLQAENAHPRIVKAYTKVHAGIAAARNYGINKATGDYIAFIDQDDMIDPELAGSVMKIFSGKDTDLVVFKYQKKYSDHLEEGYSHFPHEGTVSQQQAKIDFFSDHFFGFVWSAVFSRSVIIHSNIEFNEQYRVIDDIDFVYSFLSIVRKVTYLPKNLYFWSQTDNSESKKNISGPAEDISKFVHLIEEQEFDGNKYLANIARGYCLEQLLVYIKALTIRKQDDAVRLRLKKEARQIVRQTKIFDLETPLRKKMKFLLFRLHLLELIYKFNFVG